MQKVINVLALASFAVSGAVVGSGIYVYLHRTSIIDGVKSQVMDAVTGCLVGLGGATGGALPLGTNDLVPSSPQASVPSYAPSAPIQF